MRLFGGDGVGEAETRSPGSEASVTPPRTLLLYDADCGLCAQLAGLLPRLRLALDIRSIQVTDLAAYGVDEQRAEREMPLVRTDGTVTYGHRAWATALQTGPAPLRMVGRLVGSRLLDPVLSRVYRWVAVNRHRLPGGTPSCKL